jgi:hypothetical protein
MSFWHKTRETSCFSSFFIKISRKSSEIFSFSELKVRLSSEFGIHNQRLPFIEMNSFIDP